MPCQSVPSQGMESQGHTSLEEAGGGWLKGPWCRGTLCTRLAFCSAVCPSSARAASAHTPRPRLSEGKRDTDTHCRNVHSARVPQTQPAARRLPLRLELSFWISFLGLHPSLQNSQQPGDSGRSSWPTLTAASLTMARSWKPVSRQTHKRSVVRPESGLSSTRRRKKILTPAITWKKLEDSVLSERSRARKRQTLRACGGVRARDSLIGGYRK